MKPLHWLSLDALILSVALAGCGSATSGKKDAAGNQYDIKGKVTAVNPDKDKPTVKIDHEDIPGHMNAMEMTFDVADANLLDGIKVGDQVQGKLEKRASGDMITKLEKR
jgi:Cu/Ag efflux protein CusF